MKKNTLELSKLMSVILKQEDNRQEKIEGNQFAIHNNLPDLYPEEVKKGSSVPQNENERLEQGDIDLRDIEEIFPEDIASPSSSTRKREKKFISDLNSLQMKHIGIYIYIYISYS